MNYTYGQLFYDTNIVNKTKHTSISNKKKYFQSDQPNILCKHSLFPYEKIFHTKAYFIQSCNGQSSDYLPRNIVVFKYRKISFIISLIKIVPSCSETRILYKSSHLSLFHSLVMFNIIFFPCLFFPLFLFCIAYLLLNSIILFVLALFPFFKSSSSFVISYFAFFT